MAQSPYSSLPLDNRLSFADQGKQTSVSVCSKQTKVCRFRFPFAEKQTEVAVFP
jgi:hypothetical protein